MTIFYNYSIVMGMEHVCPVRL